jgi:hypothetical protein
VTALQYESYLRVSPLTTALEVAYHRPVRAEGLWRSVRVGGGVRATLPGSSTRLPLEAFGQVELSGRIGPWEPAAGPELGVSGLGRLPGAVLASNGVYLKENTYLGPVYLAFGMAPLRFRVGRFLVSALELHVGTTSPVPGVVVRLQLGLVNVGVSL